MRNFFLLPSILAVMMIGHVARADEATDKEQVRGLEKSCATALLAGDFQTLGSIFAEEWMVVGQDGQVMSRQQVFAVLKSGDLKFTSYELGEMDVRIFGDTAVVIGHGNPHGEARGEKFEEKEIFTDTFVRVGGKWRCVLSHSSEEP